LADAKTTCGNVRSVFSELSDNYTENFNGMVQLYNAVLNDSSGSAFERWFSESSRWIGVYRSEKGEQASRGCVPAAQRWVCKECGRAW
jgi:hypothetical protein